MKAIFTKAASVLLSATIIASACSVVSYAATDISEHTAEQTDAVSMRGLTAFQIVNDMGAGWNLGNSLESSNNETYWGNPYTTKAMIDAIAAKGFTTLRVPVRWDDHYTNTATYQIDSSYMSRVEEVVNYGLDNDMYVILNVHHNDLQHNVPNTEVISDELSAIWTQIGNHFKNYGDKLIFEVNNEPRSGDDWTGNDAYYASVNACNEAARAAIRATGGNNTDRLVMLPTYCASADESKAAAWTKAADDDMIAASIHAYLPFDFAFNGEGHTEWLASDVTELEAFFERLDTHFISKGVPVVIGEFGSCNKNNTAARETCTAVYTSLARRFAEQDIPCVVWDNNAYNVGAENFGLFKRSDCTFVYEGIVNSLVGAYDGDPEYETGTLSEIVVSSDGGSTTGSWGQAVYFTGGIIKSMAAGQSICAEYSSSKAPELILQSLSVADKGWVKINPDSTANGVAVWNYATIVGAYGEGFAGLDNAFIGDTGAALTVSKVYVNNPNAHIHSYDGTETTTLASTATTYGRKTISCSVSGCEAFKVVVTDLAKNCSHSGGIATCTDKAVCDICKTAYGELDSSNHVNIATAWTSDASHHWHECNDCGADIDKASHISNNVTESGKNELCTVCGYIITPAKASVASVTPGDGSALVKWNAVEGAVKYRVYYYLNGSYKVAGDTTATSYNVTGLSNNVKYGFLVRAYVGNTWTPYTTSDNVYATPVGAVKPVVTAYAGNAKIKLVWNKIDGATKYIVYSFANGKYTAYKTVTTNYCDVTGLTNGTKYTYLVRAYVNGVWTPYSSADQVSATPVVKPVVTAYAGNAKLKLTWNKLDGATKYIVYRYADGKYTAYKTVTTNYCDVTGLTNGTKYTYLVRAYVNGAWTAYNVYDQVSAAPVVKPVVTAYAGNAKIKLTWNKLDGATKYIVYRYADGKYTAYKTVTTNYCDVTGLTNGTKYTYLVRAYVNGAWTAYNVYDQVSAAPVVKPVISSATAGNGKVTIKWSTVDGATKYAVYIYSGGKYTFYKNTTDPSVSVSGLTNGTKYGFIVRAYVGNAWTPYNTYDIVYATPNA